MEIRMNLNEKRKKFLRKLSDAVVVANRELAQPGIPMEAAEYQQFLVDNLQFAFEQFATGKTDKDGKFSYDSDFEDVLDYLTYQAEYLLDVTKNPNFKEAWTDMNEFVQELADELYFN
jgi:hypothetical protein